MWADPTRRELLAGAGSLGATAVAGCLVGGTSSSASVLSAGSLAVLFSETVGPAFESETSYGYRGEFHGSNTVMRMVLDGQADPDVIVSADVSLLRERLPENIAAWDVVFASNALVITYNPETETGNRLATGEPWYQVLLDTEGDVAGSDPDLDPLGYRTVQLFDLAETYYGVDSLGPALRENLIVDPQESHLLAAVETGDRAAAVAYENMAVDHDLPYVSLPPELDFSDPTLADHYAEATYTTDGGTSVVGTPILYALTVPSSAPHPEAGAEFVRFLLEHQELLDENGLVLTNNFPQSRGSVPEGVLP